MLFRMTVERVTVSMPAEVKAAAQRIAETSGVPLSTVVTDAIEAWVRRRLVDAWLVEYQSETEEFTEDELRQIAKDAGVAYLPPARTA